MDSTTISLELGNNTFIPNVFLIPRGYVIFRTFVFMSVAALCVVGNIFTVAAVVTTKKLMKFAEISNTNNLVT